MLRKAFTLFELVFVIVIAMILVALAMPKSNRDPLREAADQIMAHIRYTQSLAMQDDKFHDRSDIANAKWYKRYWQIYFEYTNNAHTYNIFSDLDEDDRPNLDEFAINPQDQTKLMSAGFAGILKFSDSKASKNLNLTKRYGVQDVIFSGGCGGSGNPKRLSFDNIGRPMKGSLGSATSPYSNLMHEICNITLIGKNAKNLMLLVYPESGFVCIAKDPSARNKECDMLN